MKKLIRIALLLTSASLLAQTHSNFGNVNGIRFANQFSGADIGAKINAAAATCTSGQQCQIQIPETGQLSFSTPIVYVDNETVECTSTGILDNTTGNNSLAQLNYTGSLTAVTMSAKSGRFKGCGLLLSSSTNTGILLGNYGGRVEDADIRGGGSATKMINASGSVSGNNVDDVEIVNSRLNAYIGIGIACDNVNDLRVFNVSSVGLVGNTTQVMMLIDTNCTGVTVSDYIGYNGGAKGFWMRKTLTGLPPQSFFFRNVEADLVTGDGFLFDSTLASFPLHFACYDCWSAGNSGAGIHISGGAEITFTGAQIRANGNDGVLIDGASTNGVVISNSLIGGNNTANAGFNGISIKNHPGQIVISGNTIGGLTESGGFQQYALKTTGDVEGLTFYGNDCSTNVVACSNTSSVTNVKLNSFGNTNVVSGVSNEIQFLTGPLQTQSLSFSTTSGVEPLCLGVQPTITSGFNTNGVIGTAPNGTCSFSVTIGTGTATNTGVLGMPAATSGWNCFANNFSRADYIGETANTSTSVTLTNYGTTFAATNWTNSDIIIISCFGH